MEAPINTARAAKAREPEWPLAAPVRGQGVAQMMLAGRARPDAVVPVSTEFWRVRPPDLGSVSTAAGRGVPKYPYPEIRVRS